MGRKGCWKSGSGKHNWLFKASYTRGRHAIPITEQKCLHCLETREIATAKSGKMYLYKR